MKKGIFPIAAIIYVLILSSPACSFEFGSSSTDIAMFRANPAHTGVYAGTGPKQLNELVWKFKTGDRVSSSPAVSEGIVYFGSADGYLYALEVNTGQEQWKFKTDNFVYSSPAVSNGVVYFGSCDRYFYALDINTGQEKWKFKTGGGVYSSPVVSDGVVYFGSWDGYLYALDINTGQEQWKFGTTSEVTSCWNYWFF